MKVFSAKLFIVLALSAAILLPFPAFAQGESTPPAEQNIIEQGMGFLKTFNDTRNALSEKYAKISEFIKTNIPGLIEKSKALISPIEGWRTDNLKKLEDQKEALDSTPATNDKPDTDSNNKGIKSYAISAGIYVLTSQYLFYFLLIAFVCGILKAIFSRFSKKK